MEILHRPSKPAEALDLLQYEKRRGQRRRRVAKRLYKSNPLFAVEQMQTEFPGYTWDQYIADITRKTRKGKSHRKLKNYSFDWKTIREQQPEFFQKCIERTPTKAVIRLLVKNQTWRLEIRCMYESYENGYSRHRLHTGTLLRLLSGPIRDLVKHPAVWAEMEKDELPF